MKRLHSLMVLLVSMAPLACSLALASESVAKEGRNDAPSPFEYIPPECGPVVFEVAENDGPKDVIVSGDATTTGDVSSGDEFQLSSESRVYSYKSTKKTDKALLTASIDCVSQQSEQFVPGLSVGICGDTCAIDHWAVCVSLCQDAYTACVTSSGGTGLAACTVLFEQCNSLCNDIAWSCVGECSGFTNFDGFERLRESGRR